MVADTEKDRVFPEKIYIIYASQTGQAESISEFIFDQFTKSDGSLWAVKNYLGEQMVKRICVSKFDSITEEFLLPTKRDQLKVGSHLAIFVVSTTGEGDPPDKALKFFRWIKRLKTKSSTEPMLRHLSYVLLGLGDTNYDNFANFGHNLDRQLVALAATPYVTPEYADDAVGLELVTEPFIENFTQTLLEHFNTINSVSNTNQSDQGTKKKKVFSSNNNNNIEQQKMDSLKENFAKIDLNQQPTNNSTPSQTVNIQSKATTTIHDNMYMLNQKPVVSSCAHLDQNTKKLLYEMCTNFVQPSQQLKNIPDNQLTVPKISLSNTGNWLQLFVTKTNINHGDDSDGGDTIQMLHSLQPFGDSIKPISIYDYLRKQVNNDVPLYEAQVQKCRVLSSHQHDVVEDGGATKNEKELCCHKNKFVLECDIQCETVRPADQCKEEKYQFVPGDAIGIYSSNSLADIYQVLTSATIKVYPDDSEEEEEEVEPVLLCDYMKVFKKNVYIQLHDKTIVELLPYLTFCIDLRALPKKVVLYRLAQFTSDQSQKRRLLELSSRQCDKEYTTYIVSKKVTICDLLRIFHTCHPPIGVLLQCITAARPRYFSAAAIPKSVPMITTNDDDVDVDDHQKRLCNSYKIVFSVTNDFVHTFMRPSEQLLGFFSGKFFQHYGMDKSTLLPNITCKKLSKQLDAIHEMNCNGTLYKRQEVTMMDTTPFPVFVFPRVNQSFRLTTDPSKPLILISTGTGIAPFLSFLEYRKQLAQNTNDVSLGEIYFFFGCRDPFGDFNYSDELFAYAKSDNCLIKHLCLCFSRCTPEQAQLYAEKREWILCKEDNKQLRHVQELLKIHAKEIAELVIHREAYTYICGDWKKLSTEMAATYCAILAQHHFAMQADLQNSPESHNLEAEKYLKQLKKEGRYVLDIWA